jgi:DNA polymerase I-like protein with 3'-5' exonuclease and polymerase domains
MTKLAEGKIFKRGVLSKYDARYFAAVHDELVFSVAISDLSNFIPEVYALMTENYAGMSLPVGSSVSIGPDFGRQVELEGDFSSENLTKILQSFGLV